MAALESRSWEPSLAALPVADRAEVPRQMTTRLTWAAVEAAETAPALAVLAELAALSEEAAVAAVAMLRPAPPEAREAPAVRASVV